MSRKQNYMVGANDKAYEQREDLAVAANDLISNKFVLGHHSLTLIAYAAGMASLGNVANQAWRDLADGGVTVAREGAAIEAAWASLIPGNERLQPRPGYISSRTLASMAPLHGVSLGPARGHWGPPICLFRSAAGTPFRFHWHVGDVGNTLVSGATGSGKTLLTAMLIAHTAGRARIVALDFKRGWEMLFRALGGDYAVLGDGQPHLAPLKALDASPKNLTFLNDLIRGCIGRALTAEEDRRLSLAVETVMSLPAEDRSMGEIAAFLGSAAESASALLQKWCLGNDLGWVVDAPSNTVDVSGELQALDLTAILENPRARAPALLTIFHYIEQQLDGRPLLIPNDEGWRALLDPTFRPMIEKRLRTIRSFGGAFVFLTQGPDEIKQSEIGAVLVAQCPTQIRLPSPRASKQDHIEVLKSTEGEWEAFRQLRAGSGLFLLVQGDASEVLQLPLANMDDDIAVLSAPEKTVRILDAVRDAMGEESIETMLDEVHRRRREAVS